MFFKAVQKVMNLIKSGKNINKDAPVIDDIGIWNEYMKNHGDPDHTYENYVDFQNSTRAKNGLAWGRKQKHKTKTKGTSRQWPNHQMMG